MTHPLSLSTQFIPLRTPVRPLHRPIGVPAAPVVAPSRFAGLVSYQGPYKAVNLITDFKGAVSNAEAECYFSDAIDFYQNNRKAVERFVKHAFPLKPGESVFAPNHRPAGKGRHPGVLSVRSVCDIPDRNVQKASFDLLRFALRPNKEIHVLVVDPGVGNGQDRSILVTQNHGVLIGPNNGAFSLLANLLKDEPGEQVKIYPIDLAKVQQLERFRFNQEHYQLPKTFHGRDVFVIVAAAIAAGIDPKHFSRLVGSEDVSARSTSFSRAVSPLPTKVGNVRDVVVIRDDTSGNLKTSLFLTPRQDAALRKANATYELWDPKAPDKRYTLPLKEYFAQVEPGKPLLYVGSTYKRFLHSRFLEIALNGGNVGDALGVPPTATRTFRIRRVQ